VILRRKDGCTGHFIDALPFQGGVPEKRKAFVER